MYIIQWVLSTVLTVQYCSIKKNSVRPELVEGLLMSSWWFDKLTTNG